VARQSWAVFNGLIVERRASMSRSPGVTPDVGQVVWSSNGTQPSTASGTLTFYNEDGSIAMDTFSDCLLDDPQERRGGLIDFVYKVKDKRWRWEYPTLFGSYNIRGRDEEIISGTEKTVRELAELALDALGETGYDVSALPTTNGPEVRWHYESAAGFLDSLCSMYGCEVHLAALTEEVVIYQKGVGATPGSSYLMQTPETGVILNPAPENITAYSGDSLFESWLCLDAVGVDTDGRIKPISTLSYCPDNGWATYIDDFDGTIDTIGIQDELEGTYTKEQSEKIIELIRRHVFRTYQVIGLGKNMQYPPGFGANPFETSFRNENATGYMLVEGPNTATPYRQIATYSTRAETEAHRKNAGSYTDVVVPAGVLTFDTRNILPLEKSRITWGDGLFGFEKERLEAEVFGDFQRLDNYEAFDELSRGWQTFPGKVTVDQKRGIVRLQYPAFRSEEDPAAASGTTMVPADVYLRVGYRVRQEPYGNIYHRQVTVASGSGTGTANEVVSRTDLTNYYVQTYATEYDSGFALSGVANNTTTIDGFLTSTATERLKEYQNLQAPQKRVYTPLQTVYTTGACPQVSHSTGVGEFGKTVASIGGQFDLSQPSAMQKRLRTQQRKKALKEIQQFTSTASEVDKKEESAHVE